MIDKSYMPRNGESYHIDAIEAKLDAALEHASHGWPHLEKEIKVNRLNPEGWPPQVEAEVGSAQYHLATMIGIVTEAYWMVRKEQEHTEEVMEKVNAVLKANRCDGGNPGA